MKKKEPTIVSMKPARIMTITSREELKALTAKVRASKTYKMAYFMYAIQKELTKTGIPIVRYTLYRDGYPLEYLQDEKFEHEYETEKREPNAEYRTKYIIDNKFENYETWARLTNQYDARALQWDSIKAVSRKAILRAEGKPY